jgi:hypothetical protein
MMNTMGAVTFDYRLARLKTDPRFVKRRIGFLPLEGTYSKHGGIEMLTLESETLSIPPADFIELIDDIDLRARLLRKTATLAQLGLRDEGHEWELNSFDLTITSSERNMKRMIKELNVHAPSIA